MPEQDGTLDLTELAANTEFRLKMADFRFLTRQMREFHAKTLSYGVSADRRKLKMARSAETPLRRGRFRVNCFVAADVSSALIFRMSELTFAATDA